MAVCFDRGVRRLYSGNDRRKEKFRHRVMGICAAALAGAALLCALAGAFAGKKGREGEPIGKKAVLWMQEETKRTYLPVFAFVEEETGRPMEPVHFFYDFLLSAMPLYQYCEGQGADRASIEDEDTYDLLIRKEGMDEEFKDVGEDGLEYKEDALHIDGDLQNAMLEENRLHNPEGEEKDGDGKGEAKTEGETETKEGGKAEGEGKTEDEKRQGEGKTEEEAQKGETEGEFCKAEEKSYEYQWDEVREYEDIVSAFYAIDNTTRITDAQLNLENLLGRDMRVEKKEEEGKPQILIYHTHSQEGFVDSVAGDASTTIVGAGEHLAQILREQYGFQVMHHTGEYDVKARDYAYSNSLPALEQLLAENPSIEVVIDLHRDAVPEGKKLMVELQGRPTAQFMFFNGLSRTRQNGDIDYLQNPYVNDNLAFSFQAQVACNEYYPGLARRIYLKAYRYNMHLRAKCMLVELGAQTNTMEEIWNACEPLAHVIAKVLSGETGDVARDAAGVELLEG